MGNIQFHDVKTKSVIHGPRLLSFITDNTPTDQVFGRCVLYDTTSGWSALRAGKLFFWNRWIWSPSSTSSITQKSKHQTSQSIVILYWSGSK
ncbi:hypothetical protein YC2023_043303 [Brassica napus]